MALPTGRYKAIALWAKHAHQNSKHWVLDFVLTESGERGSAFMFNGDAGKIAGHAGLRLTDGVWLPINDQEPRPVVTLTLKFDKKYGDTRLREAERTGEKMMCDIKFYQHHFTPQDF
jgi:hypothetical protein